MSPCEKTLCAQHLDQQEKPSRECEVTLLKSPPNPWESFHSFPPQICVRLLTSYVITWGRTGEDWLAS